MRLTVLAALLLLILGGSVRSGSEMICVEDPDYVTLASVVASYGLSTSAYSGNEELSATGGCSSLTVRADSRKALVAHGAGGYPPGPHQWRAALAFLSGATGGRGPRHLAGGRDPNPRAGTAA